MENLFIKPIKFPVNLLESFYNEDSQIAKLLNSSILIS